MTPIVKLLRNICWRHSYVNIKIVNLPTFYTVFDTNIQGKLKAEKFLQYLKYELRYDILNLNKFVAQKWGTPL